MHIIACSEYPNKYGRLSQGRVFANGPGDRGSILGQIISNDAALLNPQYYKVQIKGKVE